MKERLAKTRLRGRAWRVALLALALTALTATVAVAIPPGGPAENRDGATVTIAKPLLAPNGVVEFTGAGFPSGQQVNVKVDDGLILPASPPGPAADVFVVVTADGDGEIEGQLDLTTAATADLPKLAQGSHRLRFLTGSPSRSLHADFAVRTPPGSFGNGGGHAGFVSPPAGQLLEFPSANDPDAPYADVPKLVAGSAIPFRFAGFSPGQPVNLKIDDGATAYPVGEAGADGTGAGYLSVDTSVPGTHWLRFLGMQKVPTEDVPGRSTLWPYEIIANPDGRDVAVAATAEQGGSLAVTGSNLTRVPADYVPLDPVGQTVVARIEGQETTTTLTAAADGSLAGALPVAGLPLGSHEVVFHVGFARQNDFPQAVWVREFEVVPAVQQQPTPDPVPPPPAVSPRIRSGQLKARNGKLQIVLAPGDAAAKTKIAVRTAGKVKLGPKAKKRRILVGQREYVLRPGAAQRTVAVSLTKAGKRLLAQRDSVRVEIRVKPQGAKALVKRVSLQS